MTLQHLHAAAGTSQQQIAETAGMLRNTYSAVERGETAALSYVDAQALASAFGVTAEQVHTASRAAHLAQHPRPNGDGRTHANS
jgi:transcriptional regulator with XRE-family HTH domain